MEKEIELLKQYIKEVSSFSLPKYKELPGVELYMEQVLKFINGALETLSPNEEKKLTSFMVNNYVKAKMVSEPVKKKYSREHLAYLISICLLKQVVSLDDVSFILNLDTNSHKDDHYELFKIYKLYHDKEYNNLSKEEINTSFSFDKMLK